MIGRGLATGEIAAQLHLSVKTVETHREKIKAKLALKSAAELHQHAVRWVLEQGNSRRRPNVCRNRPIRWADSPSAGAFRGFRRPAVLALVLAAAVAVIYLKVGRYDFVQLDDPTYAGANRHVRSGLSFADVKWAFAAFHDANWIPLDVALVDARFEPVGRSGRIPRDECLSARREHAFALRPVDPGDAKFFAKCVCGRPVRLHPLHVESVAWIAEWQGRLEHALWPVVVLGVHPACRRRSLVEPGGLVCLFRVELDGKTDAGDAALCLSAL